MYVHMCPLSCAYSAIYNCSALAQPEIKGIMITPFPCLLCVAR